MKTLTEWEAPILYSGETIDVVCPGCDNAMFVWVDGCDESAKVAHCSSCQLNFELKVG